MLQQIFSGSFNFYDVVAYLVAVLLIIFLILPFDIANNKEMIL